MGLFQSVFSITEDSDANLDQFQYQGGTYKKLDIDAVALVSNANQQDYSPKRPRKCYTAPRKRNYDNNNLNNTCLEKRNVVKSRHSEKIARNRPKPIVFGPDDVLDAEGSILNS